MKFRILKLTALLLWACGLSAVAATHYVDLYIVTPTFPFTNWSSAANTIQDAIDAADPGDQILVKDGIYNTGGRATIDSATNRVAVTKAVTVQSVNGSSSAIINGSGTGRCVYLTNGACLSGFTLTNGVVSGNGGGGYCQSTNATFLNCTVIANRASGSGGGVFSGSLSNCNLIGNVSPNGCGASSASLDACFVKGNSSTVIFFGTGGGLENCLAQACTITGNYNYYGAGAHGSTLNDCLLSENQAAGGGGANACVLNRCIIRNNWSSSYPGGGGGIRNSAATNCVLYGNTAGAVAAAETSTLHNCTVVGNGALDAIGGAHECTLFNCIIYSNSVAYNPDPSTMNFQGGTLNYCCTTPMPPNGVGNLTESPLFQAYGAGDFHPAYDSPCVNAGNNGAAGSQDLDGNPRVVGTAVDIGAYEFQVPPPYIFAECTAMLPNYVVTFKGFVAPDTTDKVWNFGDGTTVSNTLSVPHSWSAVGDYLVILRAYGPSNPGGINATARVHVATQIVSYVNAQGTNPLPPFSTWPTAATNIQDAVDAVMPGLGSVVLVTNGLYRTGHRPTDDGNSNRVAVTKPITLQSVNGSVVTVIDGANAVRCVYLSNGAMLSGFSLINGSADNGAGVSCQGEAAIVSNCTIVACSARLSGGGAYQGNFYNCSLARNKATDGGGAYDSQMNACTLIGNSSGAVLGTLNNCIVYYSTGYNVTLCTVNNSCTTPDPGGTNNIVAEPQMADFSHIVADSPCRGQGATNYSTGLDIDGEAWLSPPSIGCDEYHAGGITGALTLSVQASYTNVAKGFTVAFSALIEGHASMNSWDFGDGTTTSNRLYVSHNWPAAGEYPVTLTAFNETHPAGVSSTIVIHVVDEVRYVNRDNLNPQPPYLSWVTAATNIQDAVDWASLPGALVLVTNGIYQHGGRVVDGAMSNRVAVTKMLVLRSVNGPGVTFIEGYQAPPTNFGDASVRCVFLASGASLSGFTLTNGATRASGDLYREQSGGGVYCVSSSAVVSNCVIVGNTAAGSGPGDGLNGGGAGGALYGTYRNCWFMGNSAPNGNGGGTFGADLYNCVLTGNNALYGGGAWQGSMHGCWITNNTANQGGGIYGFNTSVWNCLLAANTAGIGGGAFGCALYNCTVVSNTAGWAGGTWVGSAQNSILYDNVGGNHDGTSHTFCCTTPVYNYGSFSGPPLFVDPAAGNFRLQTNSPCVNAGYNDPVASPDLDGNPRIVGGYADVGAYEWQAAPSPSPVLTANYTNLLTDFAAVFNASLIFGRASSATWDFGDGTIISNTLSLQHSWNFPGNYQVNVRVFAENDPLGLEAMLNVHVFTQIVHHVSVNGTNPVPPYFSWETAATNIQDAIDVAVPATGSHVLVASGVYEYGGRPIFGPLTNRVAVVKPITVESVAGPGQTVIRGAYVPEITGGDASVRCVYLTNGATLTGFTLTGGGTRKSGGNDEQSGGGIWCPSTNAVVSNCVISNNFALWSGGGAYGGTFNNCTFRSNRVYRFGGGAQIATLNNCALAQNSAGSDGGGANQSVLNICQLSENTASGNGGGSSSSRLIHCSLTSNSARVSGGGAYNSSMTNCIIYYNRATAGTNYFGGNLSYCCTLPLPAGDGNITDEPQLSDGRHITASSPCRGAGNGAVTTGKDIDAETWESPPSIGCDEFHAGAISGALNVLLDVDHTNAATGFTVNFTTRISGHASLSIFDFGAGNLVSNQPNVSRTWPDPGDYPVVLTAYNDSNPAGVSATAIVHVVTQPIHYVALNSISPSAPYLSWNTAATNIQEALDVAFAGATVLVSNGVYETGGRTREGFVTNRVIVGKSVTLQSVNGAAATIIRGNPVVGNNAVRCVYLANDSKLIGFTLKEGAGLNTFDQLREQSGGGAWCESTNSALLNCLLVSNSVAQSGGGVFSGTSSNCTFVFNFATNGGAAFGGVLNNCLLSTNSAINGGGSCSNTLNGCSLMANNATRFGAGAYGSFLNTCVVAGNTNSNQGAGIHSSTAINCTISNNTSSASFGGGAYASSLTNCAISRNTANRGGGVYTCIVKNSQLVENRATDGTGGAGAFQSTLYNSVVAGNRATLGTGGGGYGCTFDNCLVSSNSAAGGGVGAYNSTLSNCTVVGHTNNYGVFVSTLKNSIVYYNAANYLSSSLVNCCSTPLPSGQGNFTNAPRFLNLLVGNLRLQSDSPCINAGNNSYVTNVFDLDNGPRIFLGTVDVGAYEFRGQDNGSFADWLQKYGLPSDGSNDFTDADADGANNWQEWRADTIPTNSQSVFSLLNPVRGPTGFVVTWQSQNTRTYFLERSTNLAAHPQFLMLATNIAGQFGLTSYTDTNVLGANSAFYRIGVQLQAGFSAISYAWLQRYGLSTDGSADFSDADGDGANNWQEWRADTIPTNSLSLFRMLTATNSPSGAKVTWQSVTTHNYWLERATNLALATPFQTIATNIVGVGGVKTFTDTSATNGGPYFYRVGVQ